MHARGKPLIKHNILCSIGNLASSKNKEFLSRKNVKYVLNLTNEMEESEGLELKTILLEDDEDQEILPHLDAAFGFINKAAKSCLTSSTSKKDKEGADKATVLVHSYFGMSRSAAIVIAYLMKEKEMCLMDAYQHLKKRHPSVNPNDNFAVQLIRYEQKLFEGQMSMTVKDFISKLARAHWQFQSCYLHISTSVHVAPSNFECIHKKMCLPN